jgi:hypothetical protein
MHSTFMLAFNKRRLVGVLWAWLFLFWVLPLTLFTNTKVSWCCFLLAIEPMVHLLSIKLVPRSLCTLISPYVPLEPRHCTPYTVHSTCMYPPSHTSHLTSVHNLRISVTRRCLRLFHRQSQSLNFIPSINLSHRKAPSINCDFVVET